MASFSEFFQTSAANEDFKQGDLPDDVQAGKRILSSIREALEKSEFRKETKRMNCLLSTKVMNDYVYASVKPCTITKLFVPYKDVLKWYYEDSSENSEQDDSLFETDFVFFVVENTQLYVHRGICGHRNSAKEVSKKKAKIIGDKMNFLYSFDVESVINPSRTDGCEFVLNCVHDDVHWPHKCQPLDSPSHQEKLLLSLFGLDSTFSSTSSCSDLFHLEITKNETEEDSSRNHVLVMNPDPKGYLGGDFSNGDTVGVVDTDPSEDGDDAASEDVDDADDDDDDSPDDVDEDGEDDDENVQRK